MKYFNNFPYTAETLKKEFREYSKKLHPDTGGNAEEFKNMLNEYEQVLKNLDGHKGTQYNKNTWQKSAEEEREERERRKAEQEAEARRRRAEEEEERKRKEAARPLYEARCKKWAFMMEDLSSYTQKEQQAREAESEAGRVYGYRSEQYKEARKASKAAETATHAARRRNILKMAQSQFKGVKFSLKYYNGWGGGFTITWTDGPSLEDFTNKTDFDLFVSYWDTFDGMTDCAGFEKMDFTDFAKKYNGLRGKIDVERNLSDSVTKKLEEVITQYYPDFAKNKDPETRRRHCVNNDWEDITGALSDEQIRDILRVFGTDADKIPQRVLNSLNWSCYTLKKWVELLGQYITFKTDEKKKQEKPATFAPRYGEALRLLHKLTGVTLGELQEGQKLCTFWQRGAVKGTGHKLNILEAVEALERGEAVLYGSFHEGKENNSSWGWGQFNGGYKIQRGRAEKFAAAGYTLKGAGYCDPNSFVHIDAITPETAAKIREELADIERQRLAWEKAQKEGKETKKGPKTYNSKPKENKTVTESENDEAPAEGLSLQDIPGGVAVVGSYYATLNNRHKIKAHGCTWNKEAKQWQATSPEAVQMVRDWFAMREEPAKVTEAQKKAQQAQEAPQTEQAAQSDNLHAAPEISALWQALADLLQTFGRIATEAARFEGVTVPADTLKRWRNETEDGSKQAAEAFAEVCACLASLTPENRQEFDALGVIFWTLSEQIRNGYDPATINPATEYARAQLFDLIERTQTPQQAEAVKAAFAPEEFPDYFTKAA